MSQAGDAASTIFLVDERSALPREASAFPQLGTGGEAGGLAMVELSQLLADPGDRAEMSDPN